MTTEKQLSQRHNVQNLELLFNPRGIAVIGASPDFGRPGGQTMQVLTERGYRGGIYPVNPKYDAIAGRPRHQDRWADRPPGLGRG